MRLRYFGLLLVFSMASCFAYLLLAGRYYLHMFQLSSYYCTRFAKWQKKNINVLHIVFPIICAVFTLLICKKKMWAVFFAIFTLLALLTALKKPKQKKKMVFTARVKRQIAVFLVVYAILGIFTVLSLWYAMICHWRKLPFAILFFLFTATSYLPCVWIYISGALNLPIEKCVQKHYKDDAKQILSSMPDLKVIGITGSYGKTSSKYILNAVLSEKYNTLMTPESYNTIMGVVKTVRSSLSPLHKIFIVEMGAKHVGEIAEIAELVKPCCSVITTIGLQHLESFKTEENITKAKFEIVDSLGKDGTAFLNFDCDKIKNHPTDKNTVSFGLSDGCDYTAKDIVCSDSGTSFTVICKDGSQIPLQTKLLGVHNVMNILSAVAVAKHFGVENEKIARAVASLEPVPHRLELKRGNGYTVIDDAFNSNPTGAASALDVLSHFDGYRKTVVTPGFIELGTSQKEESIKFGEKIGSVCDDVILVGKGSADIALGIEKSGFGGELTRVDTLNEAIAKLSAQTAEKRVVLFENDLPDNYEKQK